MYTFSTLSIKYHKIILHFRKPKKTTEPFLNLLILIIIVISLFIEKKILISTMYKYMYTAVSAYHSSSTKSIINSDREHNLHFCLIAVTSNLDANPASQTLGPSSENRLSNLIKCAN